MVPGVSGLCRRHGPDLGTASCFATGHVVRNPGEWPEPGDGNDDEPGVDFFLGIITLSTEMHIPGRDFSSEIHWLFEEQAVPLRPSADHCFSPPPLRLLRRRKTVPDPTPPPACASGLRLSQERLDFHPQPCGDSSVVMLAVHNDSLRSVMVIALARRRKRVSCGPAIALADPGR